MPDTALLNSALLALEGWLQDAFARSIRLTDALHAGARAVSETRARLDQHADDEGAAALLRAFGVIAAEHAAVQRAIDGAEERLDQLPVRLDASAIRPL